MYIQIYTYISQYINIFVHYLQYGKHLIIKDRNKTDIVHVSLGLFEMAHNYMRKFG